LVSRRYMSLQKLLEENKSVILSRWFNSILETYPADTKQFLRTKKNQFDNPVAHRITSGIEGIFSQILNDAEEKDVSPFLDKVIRVRAVQDFSPSQAVAFIFDLKRLVREELGEDIREGQLSEELWRLEEEIDKISLQALDIYMKCREEIYELRVNEVKRSVSRLIDRANKICGIPGKEDDPEVCSTDNLT
ncbi:MAG: RsbRD N-terminal domain-containing protein, partial [Syntrophobacteria bacterium]